MSKKLIISAVLVAVAVAAGCQSGKPQSVRRVDQSVLPAAAKGMLAQDAQIDRVDEMTFTKGTKIYRIYYTADGKQKRIDYNSKDETTPTAVFGN